MLTKVTTPLFRSVPFASSRHQTDPSSDTTCSQLLGIGALSLGLMLHGTEPAGRTLNRTGTATTHGGRSSEPPPVNGHLCRTLRRGLRDHSRTARCSTPSAMPKAPGKKGRIWAIASSTEADNSGPSRHPDRVIVKRYASAAAGAYQFLPGTWRDVSRNLDLPSFAPEHQDQAALHLVKKRGALQEVDRNGLTKTAMNSLGPRMGVLPNACRPQCLRPTGEDPCRVAGLLQRQPEPTAPGSLTPIRRAGASPASTSPKTHQPVDQQRGYHHPQKLGAPTRELRHGIPHALPPADPGQSDHTGWTEHVQLEGFAKIAMERGHHRTGQKAGGAGNARPCPPWTSRQWKRPTFGPQPQHSQQSQADQPC